MKIKKDENIEIEIWKFNQEISRRELAEMIILHKYPFSIVEHERFKK